MHWFRNVTDIYYSDIFQILNFRVAILSFIDSNQCSLDWFWYCPSVTAVDETKSAGWNNSLGSFNSHRRFIGAVSMISRCIGDVIWFKGNIKRRIATWKKNTYLFIHALYIKKKENKNINLYIYIKKRDGVFRNFLTLVERGSAQSSVFLRCIPFHKRNAEAKWK